MKKEILDYITERKSVSFKELHDDIDGFAGEKALMSAEYENLIVWPHVSVEGIEAVVELINEKKIFLHDVSPMIYMVDGYVPSLPIAKSARNYKQPRWAPVTLSTKRPIET